MKSGTFASLIDRITVTSAVLASVILVMFVWAIEAAAPGTSPTLSITLAMGAALSAVVAISRPRTIFYGFIVVCMVFPHEIEDIFIPLGFMKLYPQDAMFAFFLSFAAWLWFTGNFSLHSIRFNRMMFVYLCLGAWSACVGLLVTSNEYDNVFGDFRRSFFYFLAYFFALVFTWKPSDINLIRMSLLVGSFGAIAKGILQAAAGDFVTRRFGDSAHVLSHFEVTFSTFAVYYALSKISLRYSKPVIWTFVAAIGCGLVVLANFRTCWVGLSAGLAVTAFLLPVHLRARLWTIGVTALLCGAAILALLWHLPIEETQSTLGANIMEKASLQNTMDDQNVSWRMDSYRNAIELWETQPIIGRGLGEELEFATATSTGRPMMAIGHRVHNSYIWLLMSLGVSGFLVLLYIHGSYVRLIWHTVRQPGLSKDTQLTLISGSALYATILTSACFDVYLESAPPITVLSVTMALCLMSIKFAESIKRSDRVISD